MSVSNSEAAAEDAAFFRRTYARLVARLSKRFGVAHLSAVEDAVQGAMEKALASWASFPRDPESWLYCVAKNQLLDELRTGARRQQLLASARTEPKEAQPATLSSEADELLRMLFACCDGRLASDSRVILALKILCGFDVVEIAQRLFRSESDVYKRLSRARNVLASTPNLLDELDKAALSKRLPSVQSTLYLLFTEGHLSCDAELPLRRELCDEAVGLCFGLAKHSATSTPSTFALLSLMLFHRARLGARVSGEFATLLLLEEQDRSSYDQDDIAMGMVYLGRSAEGEALSRYHLEAAIACEHCIAPSFETTNWARIEELYTLLERLQPSPLHRLNRALACAEAKGAEPGLALLDDFSPPGWLEGSYLWAATKADLLGRVHRRQEAERMVSMAVELAPSKAIADALKRRMGVGSSL